VVRIGEYARADNASAAAWVTAGVRGFAESVLSVVPAGFAAYGRIFHPAEGPGQEGAVSWHDVARVHGRTAHRGMQWPAVIGSDPDEHSAGRSVTRFSEPEEGSLPRELLPLLIPVLTRHTTTPEQCWFAVWNGFGASILRPGDAPTFDIPNRQFFLLTGPIRAAQTSLDEPPFWQSPNLWWPEDHAWCVATEIDFMSTYVGASQQCIDELIAQNGLEAFAVLPSDGITWADDTINLRAP
jgi:hypothetical protein